MAHPKIYCITNIQSEKLEKLSVNLVGVGKNSFNSNYIKCEEGENINFNKNPNRVYKNLLSQASPDDLIIITGSNYIAKEIFYEK